MVSNVVPDSVISCTNLLCDNLEHKECLSNLLTKMVDDFVKKTKLPLLIILYLGGLSMSNLIKMMSFSGNGSWINLESHPKV